MKTLSLRYAPPALLALAALLLPDVALAEDDEVFLAVVTVDRV